MRIPLAAVMAGMAWLAFPGCSSPGTPLRGGRISGDLTVGNLSARDIYPVVRLDRNEAMGVVAAKSSKTIGFGTWGITVPCRCIVAWTEGSFSAPQTYVQFAIPADPAMIEATKHIRFRYWGQGRWTLELLGQQSPEAGAVLATVDGKVIEKPAGVEIKPWPDYR